MKPASLALDIGATKIAVGLVPDDAPTAVLGQFRLPTQGEGYEPRQQIRAAIAQGIRMADTLGYHILRVGMGAPGVVQGPAGMITYNGDTLRNWAGTDLGELSPLPTAAHNDVRIMGYGEYHLGIGQELPDNARILVVSLGTGVGGAIIDQGQLLTGPTSSAGEISEIRCADFRGLSTRCENSVSGTGLCRYYHVLRHNLQHQEPIPWALSPGQESLPEIIRRDDNLIRTIVDGNLFGFGQALGALISAWDLAAVVIGGGVAELGGRIIGPLRHGVQDAVLSINRDVPVIRARLGKNAPLVGAACYARDMIELKGDQ
ncbi:ROK family protein [Corynebacterium poyangense]|uniref:ROK family protein n=1 Tax=Corynebacterium poyangense TaxID=2684405 RepID=A0A7H0SL27_9CORY|nr:ROK family protein [Corynebacterium poyangense]MBZ8177339.1 ROK family protein [Corynebacterium poyangense]QNQ89252.1 ROK family protein [Corynebacterium poyangense]